MRMSEQQEKVYEGVKANDRDIMLVARAGCGKTTTIVAASGVASGKVAFFAFNKAIADELSQRAPSHVKVQTLHSLGFACLRMSVEGRVKVDNDKTYNIIRAMTEEMDENYLIAPVKKLVSLVKNNLTEVDNATLSDLAATYDVEFEYNDAIRVYELTRRAIEQSVPRSLTGEVSIDFDDMIWLPVKMHLKTVPKYDWCFVDEAQDLNCTQMALILKVVKNGRICFVGDPAQAIYAFRGADSKAMDTLKDKLVEMGRNVEVLPLNETFRCPKEVVKMANRYVPDLKALESAPEGITRTVQANGFTAQPGDMVLCRMNAPLMPAAYSLMRAGVPCKVQGRDIGSNLISTIDKLRPKSMDDLMSKLEAYRSRELNRLNRLYGNRPSRLENAQMTLEDKVETIQFLASGENSLADLKATITRLFSDDKNTNCVTLSTIHRAKGLEANRVFWLQTKELSGEQEDNLKYVAITRAKNELVLVNQ